jgi:hypothetical protein
MKSTNISKAILLTIALSCSAPVIKCQELDVARTSNQVQFSLSFGVGSASLPGEILAGSIEAAAEYGIQRFGLRWHGAGGGGTRAVDRISAMQFAAFDGLFLKDSSLELFVCAGPTYSRISERDLISPAVPGDSLLYQTNSYGGLGAVLEAGFIIKYSRKGSDGIGLIINRDINRRRSYTSGYLTFVLGL